jgi:tripartite-type tricarboxylate transporter receptor subunit TctC
VARASADGHTLLLASNGTMVINPHYLYGVQYDPVRDFVLVAPLATMPFLLLVNTGLPVDTVQRLAGWLKARPGEINYSSSGEGSTGTPKPPPLPKSSCSPTTSPTGSTASTAIPKSSAY